ncbi:class I SAM-dependent methyltransferase [Brevibacillus humidisoli]|uniref:class I SAM-dependent methyltransferase n=1 Tax=Brevibacillus humidisoli TaxID=2895522 RepID=UPI001E3B3F59|nr:class I SAM-dependent methyltransferase [Brevibacillus humidisoli]UFJ42234.1 class I SAM-dependent methyltransferase [Brevibacillus humidisoli]
MIVTTGLGPSSSTRIHAEQLAASFGLPLVERGERSLDELRSLHQTDRILVVTAKGARIESAGEKPFFFHPNTASFRIKRLERGDTDTMLAVCQIQPGDHVLDATMGLGADALVFAHGVTASGRVVGVEARMEVALIVKDGLRHYRAEEEALRQAMDRVEVVCSHHLPFLQKQPDRSFDVVYFDPMFQQEVSASSGIQPLRLYAEAGLPDEVTICEALRVARRRVVLKEGKAGRLFERFGFTPFRNRRDQVTYSYKETDGGE